VVAHGSGGCRSSRSLGSSANFGMAAQERLGEPGTRPAVCPVWTASTSPPHWSFTRSAGRAGRSSSTPAVLRLLASARRVARPVSTSMIATGVSHVTCPGAVIGSASVLTVRRFRCLNGACRRRTFAESFDPVLRRYAHFTADAEAVLLNYGRTAGGEVGAFVAACSGLRASADTLLRLLRRSTTAQPTGTPTGSYATSRSCASRVA